MLPSGVIHKGAHCETPKTTSVKKKQEKDGKGHIRSKTKTSPLLFLLSFFKYPKDTAPSHRWTTITIHHHSRYMLLFRWQKWHIHTINTTKYQPLSFQINNAFELSH
mmetsp:Transcript_8555/g.11794  ORF Transcript_8555/g.11794 Transcript_8555/m.11794 type:complete len:107 (+) Transcript_8555:187-507(+)